MQLYMSWYIRSFFGFTFLNIRYFFKYSCTNIFHRRSLYTFHWSLVAIHCPWYVSHKPKSKSLRIVMALTLHVIKGVWTPWTHEMRSHRDFCETKHTDPCLTETVCPCVTYTLITPLHPLNFFQFRPDISLWILLILRFIPCYSLGCNYLPMPMTPISDTQGYGQLWLCALITTM